MTKHVDVAVVGAGILGLSVGYHLLSRQRSLRVVIVEQAPVAGAGSTGKATGGTRCQHASEVLVRLSMASIDEYRNFERLTGVDVEFDDVGYLLFASTPHAAEQLAETVAIMRRCGVAVEALDAGAIARRWPHLRTEGIRLGSWTPGDGHASPHAAVTGYLQAYRRLGGRIVFGEKVVGIEVASGSVTGLRTADRTIETPVIANVAGVEAAQLARSAGLDLPVRPYRRQVAVLAPLRLGDGRVPLTMDVDSGWYLHQQRDGTMLLGGIDKDTHPGTQEVVDAGVIDRLLELGMRLIPRLAAARLVRSYAGLRALTPDDLPILGPAPWPRGLFCACGFAGHGFMHAPAVGDLLARWILDGDPGMSGLDACLPDRFLRTSTSLQ